MPGTKKSYKYAYEVGIKGGIYVKKILVAMFDQEGYTRRLAAYLNHHQNSMMEVRLFTNEDSLKQFLKQEPVEMLLVAERDWDPRWERDAKIHRLIFLSDGDVVREGMNHPVIFKYQSAESIVQELLAVIADDDGMQVKTKRMSSDHVEFIGVYSPYGGAGVSTFSYEMAKEYGMQYTTLYLNLELFHGMPEHSISKWREFTPAEESRGMSELIFYLRQHKEKIAVKLQSLVRIQDGVAVIRAVEDYRDLYSMTVADMQRLLHVLAEETEYQKIFFDIGYIGESALELMRCCDVLYLPNAQSEIQHNKQIAFEQLLIREGEREMLERIRFVSMKKE